MCWGVGKCEREVQGGGLGGVGRCGKVCWGVRLGWG